jgi:hypothetical protein
MKIKEELLERVVKRFLRRKEIKELGLNKDEVRKVLIEHAKKYEGCIRCAYSAPRQGTFSWKARHCILQLSPQDCGMYKPFLLTDESV